MPPRFEPEIAALVAAGALGLLDGVLLRGVSSGWTALWGTALALALFTAGILVLVLRLALRLTRPLAGRWWRSLIGGLLLLPGILAVASRLFAGTGISQRWYAPYGPYVVAPLLLGVTLLGLWLIGRVGQRARDASWRRWLALPLLGLGVLLIWIDRAFYPHQYLYLHWALLFLSAAALMGLGWALLAGISPRGRWRWLAPGLLVVGALAGVLIAPFSLGSHRQLRAFAEGTHVGDRLAGVYRWLLDLDNDGHSVVFGGRDCDNRNPRIHPLAPVVPGNGVDEDCDGADERPARPRPREPGELDEETYRRQLAGWRREPDFARLLERSVQHNVVLVVVDSLRADQVLPTPENRENHPHLMQLLGESRRFTRAYSAGAGTDIGMATIFTGQLDPFAESNVSLLRAYRGAGFLTFGVFPREVERWLGRQFSFAGLTGRKVVVNDPLRRDVGTMPTSRLVTDEGIRILRAHQQQRFFLWLHYFDAHEHHQIDPELLPGGREGTTQRGRPLYRRAIRFVDQEVGRLLQELAGSGLGERTMVVLVADHGEGLGENPRLPANHGDVLFGPLVHVPLALRLPGLPGQAIDQPASLADLYPTLLDLSGIAAPPTHGLSLLPWVLGQRLEQVKRLVHPLLMFEAKQRGVIRWPWKLLTWIEGDLVELYHLERDPAEANNLADELPERTRELGRLLGSYRLITIDRLARRRR